jgi:hypothetical protein
LLTLFFDGNTRLGLPAGLILPLLFFTTLLGLVVDDACVVFRLVVLTVVCGLRCLIGDWRTLRALAALDCLLATLLLGLTACSTSISCLLLAACCFLGF